MKVDGPSGLSLKPLIKLTVTPPLQCPAGMGKREGIKQKSLKLITMFNYPQLITGKTLISEPINSFYSYLN